MLKILILKANKATFNAKVGDLTFGKQFKTKQSNKKKGKGRVGRGMVGGGPNMLMFPFLFYFLLYILFLK